MLFLRFVFFYMVSDFSIARFLIIGTLSLYGLIFNSYVMGLLQLLIMFVVAFVE